MRQRSCWKLVFYTCLSFCPHGPLSEGGLSVKTGPLYKKRVHVKRVSVKAGVCERIGLRERGVSMKDRSLWKASLSRASLWKDWSVWKVVLHERGSLWKLGVDVDTPDREHLTTSGGHSSGMYAPYSNAFLLFEISQLTLSIDNLRIKEKEKDKLVLKWVLTYEKSK